MYTNSLKIYNKQLNTSQRIHKIDKKINHSATQTPAHFKKYCIILYVQEKV